MQKLQKADEIELAIQKLGDLPQIGKLRDEIVTGVRAIPATGIVVIGFVAGGHNQWVRIMGIGIAGFDRMTLSRVRACEGSPWVPVTARRLGQCLTLDSEIVDISKTWFDSMRCRKMLRMN